MSLDMDLSDVKARIDEDCFQIQQRLDQMNQLKAACNKSHRCWPSRWGWGLAGFLACYILLMHSMHFADDNAQANLISARFDKQERQHASDIQELRAELQWLMSPRHHWWERNRWPMNIEELRTELQRLKEKH